MKLTDIFKLSQYIGRYNNFEDTGMVLFTRKNDDPKKIQATIHKGDKYERVPGRKIRVEFETTSKKIEALFARRFLESNENDEGSAETLKNQARLIPDQILSKLSREAQDEILNDLQPLGFRKIMRAPDLPLDGKTPPIKLVIYDPN